MGLPKILIASPTFEGKDYCLDEWMLNVANFAYPKNKIEIFLADNSSTNKYALYINRKYGIKTHWQDYTGLPLFEKMAKCHEHCRKYALDNNFDYLFHLETDVFPNYRVITDLLFARKNIVSGYYSILGGAIREVCVKTVQRGEAFDNRFANSSSVGIRPYHYIDGTVKPCLTAGIGCVLIHKKIFKKFKFRWDSKYKHTKYEHSTPAPDSFFTDDIYKGNQIYWLHTGVYAYHWNLEDWGKYNNLIKYDKYKE